MVSVGGDSRGDNLAEEGENEYLWKELSEEDVADPATHSIIRDQTRPDRYSRPRESPQGMMSRSVFDKIVMTVAKLGDLQLVCRLDRRQ